MNKKIKIRIIKNKINRKKKNMIKKKMNNIKMQIKIKILNKYTIIINVINKNIQIKIINKNIQTMINVIIINI